MKRFFILWFITALLLNSIALAEYGSVDPESETSHPAYISLGDEGYPVGKLLELINCNAIYYTGADNTGEPVFEGNAYQFLKEFQLANGLEESGCFDTETSLFITADFDIVIEKLVWIPMHGGHKYHVDPECSNMSEPRQIPKSAAMALEFSYCKRCWKNGDPDVPR